MHKKSQVSIAATLLGSMLICLGVTGLVFTQLRQGKHYPDARPIAAAGKCNSTDLLRRSGALLIKDSSCFVTQDSPEDVWVWYLLNTPIKPDDRLYRVHSIDFLIRIVKFERVLVTEAREGELMIEVYQETVIILPAR